MQATLWITVRDALVATWRRRGLCVLLFVTTLALVGVCWHYAPRSYASEAKLFVRVGRETVTLDPTATMGPTISVYEARETELNSVVDVMTSRAVREMVVDRLSAPVVLGKRPVPPEDPHAAPIAVNPDRDNGQAFITSFFPPEFQQYTKSRKKGTRPSSKTATVRPAPAPARTAPSRPTVVPVKSDRTEQDPTQRSEPATGETHSEPLEPLEPEIEIEPRVVIDPLDPKSREEAVQALGRVVRVYVGKKSGVITLEARAATPELAQRILKTTLDCFLVQHLRINRTPGSHKFFLEQVDLTRKELEGTTNLLRDAKNRLGVVSIEGHRKILQDRATQLETVRLDAETSLAASRATVAEMKRGQSQFPATLLSLEVTGSPNDATDRARQQIQDLELKERDLLTKYTPLHPSIVAVRQQVERARSILEERQTAGGAQRTQGINPAAQQMQLRLAEEEAKAAALEAKVASLSEKATVLRSELEALNANEAEIQQLEKRVELTQASLKTHTEKLEQARINQALEDERISNVNVVQPASYSLSPASPSAKMALLLGGALAVFNGFGLPFVWEFGRRSKPLLVAFAQPPGEGNDRMSE